MSDATVVSPGPGPFVVGGGNHGCGYGHGFNPSDSALIRSGQSYDASIQNMRETMQAKYDLERTIRETAAQNERSLQTALVGVQLAVTQGIAQIQQSALSQFNAVQANALTSGNVELLIRKLFRLPASSGTVDPC